jgi:hypothetical protein
VIGYFEAGESISESLDVYPTDPLGGIYISESAPAVYLAAPVGGSYSDGRVWIPDVGRGCEKSWLAVSGTGLWTYEYVYELWI